MGEWIPAGGSKGEYRSARTQSSQPTDERSDSTFAPTTIIATQCRSAS